MIKLRTKYAKQIKNNQINIRLRTKYAKQIENDQINYKHDQITHEICKTNRKLSN